MINERNGFNTEDISVRKKFERRLNWRTGISVCAYDLLAFGMPILYANAHGDNSREKLIGSAIGCGIGLLVALMGNPVIQALSAKATNRNYRNYCERAKVNYFGNLASEKIADYVYPDD